MSHKIAEKNSKKAERQAEKAKRWEERQQRAIENSKEMRRLVREAEDLEKVEDLTSVKWTHFSEMPICERTKMGLERARYTKLTPVQQQTLPLAVAGRDVLGAAKTGSGKTLAFILPLIEKLYREKWGEDNGVGALVLSPTRELAMQIFKVLQAVGFKHTFSAALLTGGRNAAEERKRLHAINIVIGTPGRVLAHLSEDSGLTLDNLQLFVMDEADKLLDMGFREQLTSIVEYLPKVRQTMLFSATQTTDVQALASLALNKPTYVSVHEQAAAPTPSRLCQNYLVVELHQKLDALLMFLKKHPNDKIIIFVSTCNQVKYMYLAFSKIMKKMRIPSMCLTGKMKQFRRDEIFMTFCRAKSAVLFCTDIAARGLDFPLVHWVVQYDCPDSVQTYIHRAGRTARAGARGVCLLMLTPQEVPMLSYLHAKRVPLREVAIRDKFTQDSKEIFVALVVQGLKYEAQKAFISYLRAIHFAANKAIFDLDAIDTKAFANSLGLLTVPNMREVGLARYAKNMPWDIINFKAKGGQVEEEEKEEGVVAAGSSDEGEEAEGDAAAKQLGKQPLTRRERHLKASDMFDQLQIKQRYAKTGDGLGGDDEDSGDEGDSTPSSDDEMLNGEHVPSKKKLLDSIAARTGADEDSDDDFFTVKKKKNAGQRLTAPGDGEEEDADAPREEDATEGSSRHLTHEERMAGLSKNKIKNIIKSADLRIKELGLSKRTVFADDDEDDDGEDDEGQEQPLSRKTQRGASKKEQLSVDLAIQEVGEDDEDSDDMDADAYRDRLKQKVLDAREDDKERRKALKKNRVHTKKEKAKAKEAAGKGGAGVQLESDSDDGDYDSGDNDSDMDELLLAARGQLYEDEEEEEDNVEPEHEDVAPKKKKSRNRK